MRCIGNTGKKARCLCLVLVCSMFLWGCGSTTYDMAYDKNYAVSSFKISKTEGYETADTFASDLCVSPNDETNGLALDMEQCGAAAIFSVNNGQTIYAKNIHTQMYPASLTKVMTALVALKYGSLEDTVTASPNVKITESGAQLFGFQEGDKVTLDQALHALLMYSANDAGVMIAEHIGGSEEAFSEMMNQEARALGATNSNFVNAHGLSDENHYTTAYDMYLIMNEAVKYEKFVEIIQQTAYDSVYHNRDGEEKAISLETTNQYLKGTYNAPEKVTVIGGKTGTTSAAGNCLVLYSKDPAGNPYISVVMRSEARDILYSEMTELLEQIN